MLNRFKNAVNTVVGGISTLDKSDREVDWDEEELNGGGEGRGGGKRPTVKYPYSRPDFLQLNTDEVQVSADHVSRPIMVPRDITRIPWCAGYAEVINAGKSKWNEDQARAETMFVKKGVVSEFSTPPGSAVPTIQPSQTFSINGDPGASDGKLLTKEPMNGNELGINNGGLDYVVVPEDAVSASPEMSPVDNKTSAFREVEDDPLPFTYFAIFDGHAGTGAALMAVQTLHHIIQDKLCQVRDKIIARRYALDSDQTQSASPNNKSPTPNLGASSNNLYASQVIKSYLWDKSSQITEDELVIGALESSFFRMDQVICEERRQFKITGGCTALVALFFLGKLYVANAGDSRAIIARENEVIPMSMDFTPDSERERLHLLGFLCPELLQNEFTHLEFARRVSRRDIGQKILCKNARMKGWTLKTITQDDVKYPLICGEGKRARLLATIGVTRGFGDHDLTVGDSSIYIKPFLTPAPEVRVYDLSSREHTENDVLIMGSDGLWDVTTNDRAAAIVTRALEQFGSGEKARYTSSAQELVMNARGLLRKGWRTLDDRQASGDDITAFVIPLHYYGGSQSSSTESSLEVS